MQFAQRGVTMICHDDLSVLLRDGFVFAFVQDLLDFGLKPLVIARFRLLHLDRGRLDQRDDGVTILDDNLCPGTYSR